jgi:tetratricopeptide (TPR) repeat protein
MKQHIKFLFTILIVMICFSGQMMAKMRLDSLVKEQKYQALFGKKPLNAKDDQELKQFLESCDQSFGSRKEAAKFFSDRAWEYVAEGKSDTATFRFNYVNALDSTSFESFWGLGVISFQNQNFPLALELLEKGLSLDSTQTIMRVDYAIVKLSCYLKNQTCGTLEEVEVLLARSLKEEPANANAWMKRCQVAYLLGNYESAWAYFHECRQLDFQQLDIGFAAQLTEKMPDPKGFFKSTNETDKVIVDLIEQYEMVKKENGSNIDLSARAKLVSEAYLNIKNETKSLEWKQISDSYLKQ